MNSKALVKKEHEWYSPDCTYGIDCPGCMWCDGGLEVCRACHAFEGATPDECPGKTMTIDFADLVYKGIINFRDGNWYGECAQVMRPVYDLDNWMDEQGYIRDGNNAGNPRWIRKEDHEEVRDSARANRKV